MKRAYFVVPEKESFSVIMIPHGASITPNDISLTTLEYKECLKTLSKKSPKATSKIKQLLENKEKFIFDGFCIRKYLGDTNDMKQLIDTVRFLSVKKSQAYKFNEVFKNFKNEVVSEAIY